MQTEKFGNFSIFLNFSH